MTLRDDVLATLVGWHAPDAGQEVLRATILDHVGRGDEALWRDGHLDHVTASGLVVSADGTQVLLTLHRKADRWFQFGGHLERTDTTLAGAALREAVEESGIEDLALEPGPVQLDVHEVPFCRPGARHLDVRFVLRSPAGAVPRASVESCEVRWWPIDALPSDEPSLHALVAAAL